MLVSRDEFNQRQRQWSIGKGLKATKDRLASYSENLFEPLSPQALIDFGSGDGRELNDKMCSLLRSSAALTANFFHYWSERDLSERHPLINALGIADGETNIRFEYKTKNYPLKTSPPNIDVIFQYGQDGDNVKPLAFCIESKLQELFDRKTMKFGLTYTKKRWWTECDLPKCQTLVDMIMAGQEKFEHLGADQLLKHTLGLATEFQDRFTLLYLYYEFADEPTAQQHRDEILRFKAALGDEIKFKVMTYQSLYHKLIEECQKSNCIGLHKLYLDYLALRYFWGG
jgi:hypothetical protein